MGIRHAACFLHFLAVVTASCALNAAPVVLNEFNAVSSGRYLDGEDYSDEPEKEDPFFATFPGMPDGRIQGNGGNWFELVVVEDHVDMRGWQMKWVEQDTTTGTGVIWVDDPDKDQGVITLGNADIWSDLRSGTIITISELETIGVDTTLRNNERNFTDEDDVVSANATINLATDISYSPAGGDWWIHVSTLDELDSSTPLVTTVTNVEGDSPGNFSVGNDDWQMSIYDSTDSIQFGPIGEDIGMLSGLNSREVGKLEEDPSDQITPDSNYNDGTSSTFGTPNAYSAGTMIQDFSRLRDSISVVTPLQAGDANQDLTFNQLDIIQVQLAAKYLSGQAATWGEGDWNGAPGGSPGDPPAGDGVFNQLDIVAASQGGIYLTGPYAAIALGGIENDEQTSLIYDAQTGELSVDAPSSSELTSIFITSAGNRFVGDRPAVLDGPFDSSGPDNLFKSTIGGSFGDISFGVVLAAGLPEDTLAADLSASGSLAGGGGLGDVDLIYVPEPSAILLLIVGLSVLCVSNRNR